MTVVPLHHYQETYFEADLNELFNTFDIKTELQSEVRRSLEHAAAIWRWHGGGAEKRPTPARSRATLKKVSKAAAKLHEALQSLTHPAHTALNMELAQVAMAAIPDSRARTKMPGFETINDDGTTNLNILELNEITELMAALSDMASRAEAASKAGRGTKHDRALGIWMVNIEKLWTETLGRSFTRDATPEGDPISEAAQFCVYSFGKVSPQTSQVTVINAMRKTKKTRQS